MTSSGWYDQASFPGEPSSRTTENFDHTLQAFRDRSPFRPFAVVVISGQQFEVDQPRSEELSWEIEP